MDPALASVPDAELEQIAAGPAAPVSPELAAVPDAELEQIAAASAASAPADLAQASTAELAAAAGLDPLDDFELYSAIEDEKEARGYDPADPGVGAKIWQGVTSMLGDLRALGTAVLRAGPTGSPELAATAAEATGKFLGNFYTLGKGAQTAAAKGILKAKALAQPEEAALMKRASRLASWEFAREMRDVEAVTGSFNRTLETLFPEALAGLSAVPVDPAAARGLATVADPTNFVPAAIGARWSLRAPLQGAVNAARASLRDATLRTAEATAAREAGAVALRAAASDAERAAIRRQITHADELFKTASAETAAARGAYEEVLRRQLGELEALRARVPLAERLTGRALDATGRAAEAGAGAASRLAALPDRVAQAVASGADEAAQRGVAEGVRTLVGGVGLVPAAAGTAALGLRAAGRDLRAIGRILAEAEGQLPFFRRVAQETGGLTSYTASLVDRSGLAPLVTAAGRSAAAGVEAAPFMGTVGFLQSGGDEEQIVPSAGVGAFLGMAGAGFGQWRRYANPDVVRGRQNADVVRYRSTLLPDQHQWFDKLGREDRVALASYAHAHPDLQIRYARLGKGADGFFYLGDDAGVAVVNLDSPRPLRAIVAHEVGHHLAAHGMDAPIVNLLLGDPATNQPGLYTLVDRTGRPVLDAQGRMQPTAEFRRLRDEYNAKVKTTAERSGQQLAARTDEDIAREIFAEHAADWLLSKDKAGALRLSREREGFASDRVLRRLAQTEIVNNTAFLRNLLAKSGAIFNGEGRVAGSELFGQLQRSPELTELVSQYHRRAARLRQPEKLDDGESGGLSYDAAQIRKHPEVLDKLFDASGDVARDADGRVIRNPDGTPRFLTEKEQAAARQSVGEKVFAWAKENPDQAKGLRFEERPAKGGGTEQVLVGTLPDALLQRLAAEKALNPAQLENLRSLGAAVRAGQGNTFSFFYQPATKAGGNKRYRSLRGDWRTETPYALEITRAGNIVFRTVSREKLVANAQKALQSGKGPAQELWATAGELVRDIDAYLANHAAGRPGADGIGEAKRDAINELFGVRLPSNADANPLFDQFARKAGDVVFRTRRLDRMNRVTPLEETFRVDYPKVKQNLRPGEAGDLAPNAGGPATWAEVKPGMRFDEVKRLMPKAPDPVPGFFAKGPVATVLQRIKRWLEINPVVTDADGRRILLAAGERNGGSDPLTNRAAHLAGEKEPGLRDERPRIFRADRARLVAAIPRTLADYQAKLKDRRNGNHLYFRRYADGTLHLVVVEPVARRVVDHGEVAGSLLTQFSPEGTTRFADHELIAVRRPGSESTGK
jgi:hypothetical protein